MFLPLMIEQYDLIYASKIFKGSDGSNLDGSKMIIGGTGYDVSVLLPSDIDSISPDYGLYNYAHSIGFTMRGCRFSCSFCVVPTKEGRPKSVSTIEEIWTNRDSDLLVLLDNDFFGQDEWLSRINEMNKLGLRVNFNQGLNIRLISDEQAKALSSVRFVNRSAKSRQVSFAWDKINDEALVRQGIDRCISAGIKPRQMMFYVLIGYDTTPEEDMHRVMMLHDIGCDPFVMPYNKDDHYQRRFARWVNAKQLFKSVPWENYNG